MMKYFQFKSKQTTKNRKKKQKTKKKHTSDTQLFGCLHTTFFPIIPIHRFLKRLFDYFYFYEKKIKIFKFQ